MPISADPSHMALPRNCTLNWINRDWHKMCASSSRPENSLLLQTWDLPSPYMVRVWKLPLSTSDFSSLTVSKARCNTDPFFPMKMGYGAVEAHGEGAVQLRPSCLLQGMGWMGLLVPGRTSPAGGKSPSGRYRGQALSAIALMVSLAHRDPNSFAACQLLGCIQ